MAYSDIKDPSAHFQTVTYTGDGIEPRNIDVGFQADLIWAKDRTVAYNHRVFDSSRGGAPLYSNETSAEDSYNDGPEIDFSSPYSNGFKIIDNPDGTTNSYGVNMNNNLMVSWNWKANGGTTSSNTDGSITSTVQANTNAGFSIVTYTGTGSAATVGHGLGITPDMIIFKNRSGANVWAVYHQGIGNNKKLELNSDNAEDADGAFMNGTLPTASVFSVGASANTNTSSSNYVAYCFNSVQGYSKFGKYRGNSSTDGTFVYLGFKPRFVIIRSTQAGVGWFMHDTKRSPTNVMDDYFRANLSSIEGTSPTINIDFLSNGFKLRYGNNTNFSSHDYVYIAFAENPFVAGGIPTTAR